MQVYKLVDILYIDNGKGPYKESKVGQKYDFRRNRNYIIDEYPVKYADTDLKSKYLCHVDEYGRVLPTGVITTPCIREYNEDGYHWLETENSFYKFEKVDMIIPFAEVKDSGE